MATKTADIGYLAGIIDGEGCIQLRDNHNKGKRFYPRVTVKMTDLDVLEKCQQITGAGIINTIKNVPEGHKPQWRWEINKQADAAAVLMMIFPLVSERRKQKIEQVLRGWRS